ncbi:hypothetical protein C6P46_005211 [Rhodotorula mucilaginosa]|uniref:Uncharacterized protein n=1 Tax=Rhodotorula mucilaginosa TaxID=5537 RepID=A0A9P6W100_RHOMI|nr:hypothetical protein C6P46_005211 [Rhodotorula mucilaginosa]
MLPFDGHPEARLDLSELAGAPPTSSLSNDASSEHALKAGGQTQQQPDGAVMLRRIRAPPLDLGSAVALLAFARAARFDAREAGHGGVSLGASACLLAMALFNLTLRLNPRRHTFFLSLRLAHRAAQDQCIITTAASSCSKPDFGKEQAAACPPPVGTSALPCSRPFPRVPLIHTAASFHSEALSIAS